MVVDPTFQAEPEERPCPGCGDNLRHLVGRTWYSKTTLVEIRGVYDGGLFCAHTRQSGGCGFAWHRWPKGHHLRVRAEEYVKEWNHRYREAKEAAG
jgi:hypothetical protein